MRIALLAPLPPEQTGIADYAAVLKASLESAGFFGINSFLPNRF